MNAPDSAKTALVRERERAVEQIDALASDLNAVVASTSEVATDDEHDPEGQTIAFERQQIAALLESARARLIDLDAALERLDTGTYGRCEQCGIVIPDERLAARPETRTCVACAREKRVRA